MDIGGRLRSEIVGRFIAAFAGGLLIVSLARILNPTEYGILFLAVAVLGVIELFAKLGIPRSTARYIMEYKESDPTQLRNVIQSGSFLVSVAAVFVTVFLFLSHSILADALGEPQLAPFLQLGGLYLIFEVFSLQLRMILQGFEENRLSVTVLSLNRIGRLIFAVSFALLNWGAIGSFAGFILGSIVSTIAGVVFLLGLSWTETPAGAKPDKGLRRRIANYAIPLTATEAADILDSRIDTILVGIFLTPVAVSYYVISKQAIGFLKTPAEATSSTVAPSIGSIMAENNIDQASHLFETAIVQTLLLYLPASIGLILVAESLVELIFGSEYIGAVPVLQVLSVFLLLLSIGRIVNNVLDYVGRARSRAIAQGIAAGGNVVLNIFLIPTMGVVGAAIATVITHSAYTASILLIAHSEFGFDLGYLLINITKIIWITISMTAVVTILIGLADGPLALGVVIAIGVGVWLVLSVIAGLVNLQGYLSI